MWSNSCQKRLKNGDDPPLLNLAPPHSNKGAADPSSEKGRKTGFTLCSLSPFVLQLITWHSRHTKMWEAMRDFAVRFQRDGFSYFSFVCLRSICRHQTLQQRILEGVFTWISLSCYSINCSSTLIKLHSIKSLENIGLFCG